jgi:hypothetical protein
MIFDVIEREISYYKPMWLAFGSFIIPALISCGYLLFGLIFLIRDYLHPLGGLQS